MVESESTWISQLYCLNGDNMTTRSQMHTIEPIGKYLLISGPPTLRYKIGHIIDVIGLIFRYESNETIFKSLRCHLHGVGGQVD